MFDPSKVCFIYTDWAYRPDKKYGGVGYYRIVKPAQALGCDFYGEDLKSFGSNTQEIWQAIFEKYDTVVIKQSDAEVPTGMMLFFAEHYGKKVIFDFDDNVFEVRPDQDAYRYYAPGCHKRAIVSSAMSLCHGMIVSTEPLKEYFSAYLKKVYNIDMPIYVCPNVIDAKDWPKPEKTRRNVIGYAGSVTHNSDLKMIVPSLEKLMKANPTWEFEILGGVKSTDVSDVFRGMSQDVLERISLKGGTLSWNGYPELLASQGWNVGLAPLIDDEFNRGKSHIKWMEYALSGIS